MSILSNIGSGLGTAASAIGGALGTVGSYAGALPGVTQAVSGITSAGSAIGEAVGGISLGSVGGVAGTLGMAALAAAPVVGLYKLMTWIDDREQREYEDWLKRQEEITREANERYKEINKISTDQATFFKDLLSQESTSMVGLYDEMQAIQQKGNEALSVHATEVEEALLVRQTALTNLQTAIKENNNAGALEQQRIIQNMNDAIAMHMDFMKQYESMLDADIKAQKSFYDTINKMLQQGSQDIGEYILANSYEIGKRDVSSLYATNLAAMTAPGGSTYGELYSGATTNNSVNINAGTIVASQQSIDDFANQIAQSMKRQGIW